MPAKGAKAMLSSKGNAHLGKSGNRNARVFPEEKQQPILTNGNEPLKILSKKSIAIPHVEVAVKIYSITCVNQAEHIWSAEFIVMLDWEGGTSDFVPRIEIENAIEHVDPTHQGKPRVKKGRTTLTLKYRNVTMLSRMDMRSFPFDVQYLEIRIKSQRIEVNGKNHKVMLLNPKKFRKRHQIVHDADMLPDWELVKIWGAPLNFEDPQHTAGNANGYCVQVCVKRETYAVIMNFWFPIACIAFLSVTAFGVSPDSLSDRMEINLTLTLTIVAFKATLDAELPKVPYVTVLGKFNLAIFAILLIQGIAFYIISECLMWHCTEESDNWFLGTTRGGGHFLIVDDDRRPVEEDGDDTGNASCEFFTAVDKLLLFLSILWILGWILWAYWIAREAEREIERISGPGPMDPDNTEANGLRMFEHGELKNDTIECSYENFEAGVAAVKKPSIVFMIRDNSTFVDGGIKVEEEHDTKEETR